MDEKRMLAVAAHATEVLKREGHKGDADAVKELLDAYREPRMIRQEVLIPGTRWRAVLEVPSALSSEQYDYMYRFLESWLDMARYGIVGHRNDEHPADTTPTEGET